MSEPIEWRMVSGPNGVALAGLLESDVGLVFSEMALDARDPLSGELIVPDHLRSRLQWQRGPWAAWAFGARVVHCTDHHRAQAVVAEQSRARADAQLRGARLAGLRQPLELQRRLYYVFAGVVGERLRSLVRHVALTSWIPVSAHTAEGAAQAYAAEYLNGSADTLLDPVWVYTSLEGRITEHKLMWEPALRAAGGRRVGRHSLHSSGRARTPSGVLQEAEVVALEEPEAWPQAIRVPGWSAIQEPWMGWWTQSNHRTLGPVTLTIQIDPRERELVLAWSHGQPDEVQPGRTLLSFLELTEAMQPQQEHVHVTRLVGALAARAAIWLLGIDTDTDTDTLGAAP